MAIVAREPVVWITSWILARNVQTFFFDGRSSTLLLPNRRTV